MSAAGKFDPALPIAVYRWTEREVHKILLSYDPAYRFPVTFFHGLRLPYERLRAMRHPVMRLLYCAFSTAPVCCLLGWTSRCSPSKVMTWRFSSIKARERCSRGSIANCLGDHKELRVDRKVWLITAPGQNSLPRMR